MTVPFIGEDFLLESESARRLYHEHAKQQPIIDYHCHLSPQHVAEDHRFSTMTELWLCGDHYKWRAMRANGVPERCCTGDASDEDKFVAWAKTVPHTLRNPLYHWTHLELAFPFGIRDCLLDERTALQVYERCNARLQGPEFTACGLLRQFDVRLVCTTDDPTDGLEHHRAHAARPNAATRLLPTWRPDMALSVEEPESYNTWLDRLAEVSDVDIGSYHDLLTALRLRHTYFHDAGCRLSDHGLTTMFAASTTEAEVVSIFDKVRSGKQLRSDEVEAIKSALLHEFGLMDHERGWVQQFHVGALRDNNTRLLERLGPNTGFDSIGDLPVADALSRFLDRLDRKNQLAKTILYNLNPRDNEVYATMVGNFQDGSVAGKMQYGAAWWFLDQRSGMLRQLDALSNMGLLSRFVGMLTDSRSFLSYSRHDYFRRLLCNLLGDEMQRGLLPGDLKLVGTLVENVCYRNAERYFPFDSALSQ